MARIVARVTGKSVGGKSYVASGKRYAVSGKMARRLEPRIGSVKKPHRYKPGTVAMREVKRAQHETKNLLPRTMFERIVRLILERLHRTNKRITAGAMEGLREGGQAELLRLLTDASLSAIHVKRRTVMEVDLELARRLAGAEAI